jgi:hypothetical protein
MLPLLSITSPTVTGLSSFEKNSMFCRRPSSYTVNASRGSPDTKPDLPSSTVTCRTTNSEREEKTGRGGGSWASVRAA